MYLQFLSLSLWSLLAAVQANDSNSAVSNTQTSLTLMYQNNLNVTDDVNHVGFILLDQFNQRDTTAACKALGETLVPSSMIRAHQSDFFRSLAYNAFAGRANSNQEYYIQDGVVTVNQKAGTMSFGPLPSGNTQFPVLCTQSSNESQPGTAVATPENEISVVSSKNTYVGFRNQKSFRFLGIRYADEPQRWEFSTPFTPTGQTITATAYGPECPQFGVGNEDCLFLNIQTPFIPKQGEKKNLRPVLFWIHGGGYVTGDSSDPGTDGGNLASHEDIVTVTISYRLGTLGFWAVPGTNITGNFGFSDQINALEWTIANIANFGGDPDHITIAGDSAGAGSVRVLLGSPKAIGKFQAALAVSNLGGGVDLGLPSNAATTYSSYITLDESFAMVGENLFQEAGCNQATLEAQIACLKGVDGLVISNLAAIADKPVQDGIFINTEELDLVNRNGSTAHVPVMFGNCENEGASIGAVYPTTPVTNQLEGIEAALSISTEFAQAIIDSKLFPFFDTGNITLDSFNVSQRVATNNNFRCVDQATVFAGTKSGVFPAAYYFQFTRTIGGYDPNNLGGPPVTPGFPFGNPNLPYFRFHSSDIPWITGNMETIRDPADLFSVQLQTSYFGSYFRSFQPNPAEDYLEVRGYTTAIEAIRQNGPWESVQNDKGPIRLLDWPSVASDFVDLEQCAWLNYSISYYVDGGL